MVYFSCLGKDDVKLHKGHIIFPAFSLEDSQKPTKVFLFGLWYNILLRISYSFLQRSWRLWTTTLKRLNTFSLRRAETLSSPFWPNSKFLLWYPLALLHYSSLCQRALISIFWIWTGDTWVKFTAVGLIFLCEGTKLFYLCLANPFFLTAVNFRGLFTEIGSACTTCSTTTSWRRLKTQNRTWAKSGFDHFSKAVSPMSRLQSCWTLLSAAE